MQSNTVWHHIFLQTPTPSQKTSGQHSSISEKLGLLFLSLITESPNSLSSIVSLPLNLSDLSETSVSFGCQVSCDHTSISSKTKPLRIIRSINAGGQFSHPSVEHLNEKSLMDGFTAQVLCFYWIKVHTVTTVPLQRTIMVESHHFLSTYYCHCLCLAFLSKTNTNVYYTTRRTLTTYHTKDC